MIRAVEWVSGYFLWGVYSVAIASIVVIGTVTTIASMDYLIRKIYTPPPRYDDSYSTYDSFVYTVGVITFVVGVLVVALFFPD